MRQVHTASSPDRTVHGVRRDSSTVSCLTAVDALATIRHGWSEYISQPVLPASLAYVLVCFNVALAPGALMTTFLIHHGACICATARPGY